VVVEEEIDYWCPICEPDRIAAAEPASNSCGLDPDY
jgi:hypothetical protein